MRPRPRWVLATGNTGKLAEMRALLAGLDIALVAQSDFATPAVDETGIGFIDNALLKARHAAAHTGLAAIADDSGLAVDALAGAPGVLSARYAGGHGDADANNARLLDELRDVAEGARGAAFHCCLVATRGPRDPAPMVAHGIWRGAILRAPRGRGGFGYDPLFWIAAEAASAAELDAKRKNAISHRAHAARALVAQWHEHG